MIPPNDNKSAKKRNKKWYETATAAQYAKILKMLIPYGKELSTHQFRREGIMQPAARLKELRDQYGYAIYRVALRTIYDDWGYAHKNVAFYAMQAPKG